MKNPLRKWYIVQLILSIMLVIGTIFSICIGEVLFKKTFLYSAELFAVEIGIFAISLAINILALVFRKDDF